MAFSPKSWRDHTIGKSYDVDGMYGPQCWDYWAEFILECHIPVEYNCAISGYAEDIWRLKDKYGYANYFDYIYNASELRDGDWCIWGKGSSHPYSHIAMFWQGLELGQNQGNPNKKYISEERTSWDILGALRWKGWNKSVPTIGFGKNEVVINEHSYVIYRQNPETEDAVVISAGLNKLATIDKLDIPGRDVMAKFTGANYFQMRTDTSDPYGTTYGDLSAPLNGAFQSLPNQDSTLIFDVETGNYGDCTGVEVDKTHNVFSPSVVYPQYGDYQYARMVGMDHVNVRSRYCFVVRLHDGSYAGGIALQDMTPKEIANDIREYDICSISFLDGGGSANAGMWNKKNKVFEYIRDTRRECPSAFGFISKNSHEAHPVIEPDPAVTPTPSSDIPVQPTPTPTEEDKPMDTKPQVEPVVIRPSDGWTDPETLKDKESLIETVVRRFLSVKSLVTLILTAIFAILALRGTITNEQFMSIFTMCISFFFGYSFEKKENSGGGK